MTQSTNPLQRDDGHALKLAVFGVNVSGGCAMTSAPGTLAVTWPETRRIAQAADAAGLDGASGEQFAVQVHRNLQQTLEQSVSLTDLYRFPTIASLAGYLGGDGPARAIGQASDRGARRRQAMARRRKARGG